MRWFFRPSNLSVLAAALLAGVGCARQAGKQPTAEALLASLDGVAAKTEEISLTLESGGIAGFRVIQVYEDPKSETASAVIAFQYVTPEHNYRIEGVISYERNDAGEVRKPLFEINECSVDG